jgi:predicted transcriptional regulator
MMNTPQDAGKDTTVRVPRELLEQVRAIARAHDRSLAAEVRVALTEYVRTNTTVEAS